MLENGRAVMDFPLKVLKNTDLLLLQNLSETSQTITMPKTVGLPSVINDNTSFSLNLLQSLYGKVYKNALPLLAGNIINNNYISPEFTTKL